MWVPEPWFHIPTGAYGRSGQSHLRCEEMDAPGNTALWQRMFMCVMTTKREDDARLLDRTMVLFGSNMGDANKHDNTNLPILLAGGGFKHGQHLAFDPKNNTPLCNLYITMLQRLGIETDRFGSGTRTLSGLEMV